MSQRVEGHLACAWGQITPCLWQMLIMGSMKLILIQVWLFCTEVLFHWQIWASFAVLPDAAGKTMPVFFVKWFGAVWMKWLMQELDIYFPVAITSSLYLAAWIRATSDLSSGVTWFLLLKLVPQDPWIKLCCSCFSFHKRKAKRLLHKTSCYACCTFVSALISLW